MSASNPVLTAKASSIQFSDIPADATLMPGHTVIADMNRRPGSEDRAKTHLAASKHLKSASNASEPVQPKESLTERMKKLGDPKAGHALLANVLSKPASKISIEMAATTITVNVVKASEGSLIPQGSASESVEITAVVDQSEERGSFASSSGHIVPGSIGSQADSLLESQPAMTGSPVISQSVLNDRALPLAVGHTGVRSSIENSNVELPPIGVTPIVDRSRIVTPNKALKRERVQEKAGIIDFISKKLLEEKNKIFQLLYWLINKLDPRKTDILAAIVTLSSIYIPYALFFAKLAPTLPMFIVTLLASLVICYLLFRVTSKEGRAASLFNSESDRIQNAVVKLSEEVKASIKKLEVGHSRSDVKKDLVAAIMECARAKVIGNKREGIKPDYSHMKWVFKAVERDLNKNLRIHRTLIKSLKTDLYQAMVNESVFARLSFTAQEAESCLDDMVHVCEEKASIMLRILHNRKYDVEFKTPQGSKSIQDFIEEYAQKKGLTIAHPRVLQRHPEDDKGALYFIRRAG